MNFLFFQSIQKVCTFFGISKDNLLHVRSFASQYVYGIFVLKAKISSTFFLKFHDLQLILFTCWPNFFSILNLQYTITIVWLFEVVTEKVTKTCSLWNKFLQERFCALEMKRQHDIQTVVLSWKTSAWELEKYWNWLERYDRLNCIAHYKTYAHICLLVLYTHVVHRAFFSVQSGIFVFRLTACL